jgi:hypothetical protein
MAMESGKVSKVVCWRLDRLGRTAKGLTALFDDLIANRITKGTGPNGTKLRRNCLIHQTFAKLFALFSHERVVVWPPLSDTWFMSIRA